MSEEKCAVLKMLEEKKISFEEAIALLNALNENTNDIKPDFNNNFTESENTCQDHAQQTHDTDSASSNSESFKEKYAPNTDNLEKTFKRLGKTFEQLGDRFEVKMNGFSDEVEKKVVNSTNTWVDELKQMFGTSHTNFSKFSSENHYPIQGDMTFDVITLNGRIMVEASDDNEIHVFATYYIHGQIDNFIPENYIEMTMKGSSYNLQALPNNLSGADIKILLPKQFTYNLNLKTSNGKITCTDLNLNTCEALTSNAKILLSNCSVVNGNLRTSNSKIGLDLLDIQSLKSLNCTTSNSKILGSFKNLANREGRLVLNTTSGKIDVDSPFLISAATSNTSYSGSQHYEGTTKNYQSSDNPFEILASTTNSNIYFD